MKLVRISGVIMLMLLVSTSVVHSVAQQPPVNERLPSPVPATVPTADKSNPPFYEDSFSLSPQHPIVRDADSTSTNRNPSLPQQLREAVRALQNPESSDKQRSTAREFVQQALRQQFVTDLDNRRQQLEAMEKQLTRLREQLTRRSEAMNKLVELRLQLLENEASGLGFPEEWSRLPGTTGSRGTVMGPMEEYMPHLELPFPKFDFVPAENRGGGVMQPGSGDFGVLSD